MCIFTEYLKASEVFPGAEDYIDEGPLFDIYRGYSIEVKRNNVVEWLPIAWTALEESEWEFDKKYFEKRGVVPTGRICFHGYAENNHGMRLCPIEEARALAAKRWVEFCEEDNYEADGFAEAEKYFAECLRQHGELY